MTLTLRQEMWISNTLSTCARQKWIGHENGHVRDNQAVMPRMEAAIRANATLQGLLINPQHWHALALFTQVQQTIQVEVAAIFQD